MKLDRQKGIKELIVPTHLDLRIRQWPGEAYGVVFDCASSTSLLVSASALRLLCDLLDYEPGYHVDPAESPHASRAAACEGDGESWRHAVSELQDLGLIERAR